MINSRRLLKRIVDTRIEFAYSDFDVNEFLKKLESKNKGLIRIYDAFGYSENGHPIPVIDVGDSKKRLLSFGRIHGDEKSSTYGVLGTANFLSSGDELAKEILGCCSFVGVPMLNPDGALDNKRLNSKRIDINRDFESFASKEALTAKSILRYFNPSYVLDHHESNKSVSTVFGNENEDDLKGRVEASIVEVWKGKNYRVSYSISDKASYVGQLVNFSSDKYCSSTIVEVSRSNTFQDRIDMHSSCDLITMLLVGSS